MAPLLVTGLTTLAGNMLDSYNNLQEHKQAANTQALQAPFQEALNKANAMSGGSARLARQVKMDHLRQALMNSPEVKTAIDSADPTRLPSLNVGADGRLSMTAADGRAMSVQFSPETQAMAQELAGMQAATPVRK